MHSPDRIGGNRLLGQLSLDDFSKLRSHCKEIALKQGEILHAARAPIEHVYFPLSGMVSLLVLTQTGEAIEIAIVGREGMVGSSVASERRRSFNQAAVQMEGAALRMGVADFIAAVNTSAPLRTLVNRYQSIVLLQAQQTAACNALHGVEERLCRWLLHAQDASESESVMLTQEFLSHMLGVQRNSVSLAAGALQHAGLIKYSRGHIKILSRSGLEEAACECYGVIRREIDEVVPPLR